MICNYWKSSGFLSSGCAALNLAKNAEPLLFGFFYALIFILPANE